MSESQEAQIVKISPQHTAGEADNPHTSSEHQEVLTVANMLLSQEVLEEGGYADRLHPPPSREVVRKKGESEEDWQVRKDQREQWWQQEPLAIASREQAFFQKVYTQTMATASKHNGPIRLMFDVDQTISDFIENHPGPKIRIIRPAFTLVVDMLRKKLGDRLQIGLLTTLPPDEVKDECLADIDPNAIDKELLIGARQYAKEHPDLMLEEIRLGTKPQDTVLANLSTILRPDVIEAVKAEKLDLAEVRDIEGKLEILGDLHKQYPDTTFVFIDNQTPAGMIQSEFVEGIHVGHEMQDSMFANYRNLFDTRMSDAGLSKEYIPNNLATTQE